MIRKISICFLVLSLIGSAILSVVSVAGEWNYPSGLTAPLYHNLELTLFPWEGQEVLPDDDDTGTNHIKLIDSILNGTYQGQGIGLNHSGSYLNKEIKDRSNSFLWFGSDTLGSMDFWERADISKYFDTETLNVSFVLHFPEGVSDTYYLYTLDVALSNEDGSPVTPIGQNISPVYRTVLQINPAGKWEAVSTELGYAKSAYYENRVTGEWLQYPSIDPDSWKEGTP